MLKFNNFLWVLILLFAILLIGCSDDDNPSNSNNNGNELAEGTFAELVVGRTIMQDNRITFAYDGYVARLDSCYAPCSPLCPINGATVVCNDTNLSWEPVSQTYLLTGIGLINMDEWYKFDISGNGITPLVDSIQFPSSWPYITYPEYLDTISKSGDMNIIWDNPGIGMVDIVVTSINGDSLYFIQTANDGLHTIGNANLAQMPTGQHMVILSHYNRKTITAAGYDPRGIIAGRVISPILFNLE